MHGLQLGSALSGWLELSGKLSPCGGEGLVHISGYSLENASNPPDKKKKTSKNGEIPDQNGDDSMYVKTRVHNGDNCSWGYFSTLFTPDQLVQ